MRFISTKAHGILDYLAGIILLVSPWLFGFATGGAAQWIPVIIGAMIILMSLFTAYELGAAKQIPISAHLSIDVITGIFLAVSPWLFGFADVVFWPHLIFGLLEAGAGLLTRTRTAEVAAV